MKRSFCSVRQLALALFLTVVWLTAPTALLASGGKKQPPNLVVFLTDDHRFDLLGCAGHPHIKTPTLDKLAKRGVGFSNAFVTTAICAASRASIFTGLHERTHLYTFGTPPLDPMHAAMSYPWLLRQAGYRTGFVGKFGVNVAKGDIAKMFDVFHDLFRTPYFKKQADGTLRHIDDIAGDHAIAFLKDCKKDQPFCLSVSFNSPHAEDADKLDPFPAPKAVQGLYDKITVPAPRLGDAKVFDGQPEFLQKSLNRIRWHWWWDTPEKYQKNIKAYYSMISGADAVVGRVLEELAKLGLDDNTIVIFSADNGDYLGNRGFAGKWSHYEDSLRVPLVICDPRLPKSKQGKVNDQMVLNIDLPATMLDYAGMKTPALYQGRSLAALMQGQKLKDWRTDFFCEHLMNHKDIPRWEGVRDQRWVYARYFEQKPAFEFLHDLQTDPDELKNLAADPKFAPQMDVMRKRCDALRDRYGGPFVPRKKV